MTMKIKIGMIMRRMAKERALTTMEAAMIGNFLNLRGMVIVKIEPFIDGYRSRSKGSSGDNSDRNRSDDGYESVGYDVRLRRDKNFHIAKDKDDYDDYDMDDYNDYPRISGSEDDDEWAGVVLDYDGHYLITS